jgi:hypothetical protein
LKVIEKGPNHSLKRTLPRTNRVSAPLSFLIGQGIKMKKAIAINLLISALAGASIWFLSPFLAGHKEPWDSPSYYYLIALSTGGLFLGLILPRQFWAHYPGIILGQFAYSYFFLPVGPLWPIGLGILVINSLACLVASAIGAGLRRLFNLSIHAQQSAPADANHEHRGSRR